MSRRQRPVTQRFTRVHLDENAILRGLPGAATAAVLDSGELRNVSVRQRIYVIGKEIDDVYFPLEAVISIVAQMAEGLTTIRQRPERAMMKARNRDR